MRLIVMFIAIALAAGAFFLTMHFTNRGGDNLPVTTPQAIYKEVPTVDVYTAKQEIPIGAIITPDMLDIQPWPRHLKIDDMVEANPNQASNLVKMVARTPFTKGEPIMMSRLANEKDPSFLAASLPKGMRVVTVAVDQVSGVAGFVFPGDRVDVLVTHDISLGSAEAVLVGTKKQEPKKDPVTEVLLSNIRVMAVNQKSVIHSGEPPQIPSTISLEVSASDAQKLRLTENGNGRLSLALRSLHDKEEIELARPTGLGDLSRLTPPAYFSVLYDLNGQATGGEPAEDMGGRAAIIVVRGVTAEAVEVSQP